MTNPIQALDDKIDALAATVERSIEIKIVRETARWHISRLLTLDEDPKRQADYNAALTALAAD